MRANVAILAAALPAAVLVAACDRGPDLDVPQAIEIDVPAAAGASLPNVAAADDAAILSWVEPADDGHQLRFAAWDGTSWSAPRTVASGANWFVNWADFPSVVSTGADTLAAHWLQRSGPGTYAYDVMVSTSSDGGATWSAPVKPHADGTETEHGFVSLFPHDGGLGIIWLDGRAFATDANHTDAHDAAPTNEMAVRFTTLGASPESATPSTDLLLDPRACDCCQTDVALTAAGPLVVYRDRSRGEVRDVVVMRLVDGDWTKPVAVHNDGWQIDACPVNGPQVAAIDSSVAVAWFTAANDSPRVNIAFSDDNGAAFGAPVRVDDGNPVGRADVLLLDPARALVTWVERVADSAEVRARIVTRAGTSGASRPIAQTLAQRASGFPRMARYNGGVLIAWTQPGDTSHVRAATLPLR